MYLNCLVISALFYSLSSVATSYGEICKPAACDFGQGQPCAYTSTGNPKFENQQHQIGNKGTGVPGPVLGKQNYQGVVLQAGGKAILHSGLVSIDPTIPKSLQVHFYEATTGMVLKACSNDENHCQLLSDPVTTKVKFHVWQYNTWPVPPLTTKILLIAQNHGRDAGAVGIDKVEVFKGTLKPEAWKPDVFPKWVDLFCQ